MAGGFLADAVTGISSKVSAANTPGTSAFLIKNAPEIPDVQEAIAQTRQLVLRNFSPKPFGGALATAPFGLADPRPGTIGQQRKLVAVT